MNVHVSSTDSSTLDGIDAISSGYSHTCALTEGSNVKCWGNGRYGRLGNKATTNSSTPVDVQASSTENSPLDGIATISSGRFHTCAITTGGNVKCWGRGNFGQLGNGGETSSSTPVDVQASSTENVPLGDIAAISSGDYHTCAVTKGGNAKCWGYGFYGLLGNGEVTSSSTPVDVHASSTENSPLDGIVAISSGGYHTCALTTGGNVKCWGRGESGQLGNGGETSSLTPVDVQASSTGSAALSDIAEISSGHSHTCALTTGDNVVCWGAGNSGQLGNGGETSSLTPVDVQASSTDSTALSDIAEISSRASHTCALTTGDNVVCWGAGSSGQLGNGGATNSSTPVDVHASSSDTSALSDIAEISSGHSHTCALTDGNNVKCWGGASFGQLGNNEIGVPVSVIGLGPP